MKKKSILFRVTVFMVCLGGVIALLEVFNLHPEFSVGRFHSVWVGVRHMDFISSKKFVAVPGGKKLIQRDYDVGPLKIIIGA